MAWAILGPVVCLVLLGGTAQGLQLQVRRNNLPVSNVPHGLVSRTEGGLSLDNTADISYYANISLGNQNFKVLIDTGRYLFPIFARVHKSEIPLAPTFGLQGKLQKATVLGLTPALNTPPIPSQVRCLASLSLHLPFIRHIGPIKQARLNFAGHYIPDQAFCQHPFYVLMNACSYAFFSGNSFRIKENRGWWNSRHFSFVCSKHPNFLIWKSRFGTKFGFVHRTAIIVGDWFTSLGPYLPPEPLCSQFLYHFVGKRQRYVTTCYHQELRCD